MSKTGSTLAGIVIHSVALAMGAAIIVSAAWLMVAMSRGIVHMLVDIVEAWPWR